MRRYGGECKLRQRCMKRACLGPVLANATTSISMTTDASTSRARANPSTRTTTSVARTVAKAGLQERLVLQVLKEFVMLSDLIKVAQIINLFFRNFVFQII